MVALAAAMIVGFARVGDVAVRQQRSQAVADVAVLATAAVDADAGAAVAGRNAARVLHVRHRGDGSIGLVVELEGQQGRAAADPG